MCIFAHMVTLRKVNKRYQNYFLNFKLQPNNNNIFERLRLLCMGVRTYPDKRIPKLIGSNLEDIMKKCDVFMCYVDHFIITDDGLLIRLDIYGDQYITGAAIFHYNGYDYADALFERLKTSFKLYLKKHNISCEIQLRNNIVNLFYIHDNQSRKIMRVIRSYDEDKRNGWNRRIDREIIYL